MMATKARIDRAGRKTMNKKADAKPAPVECVVMPWKVQVKGERCSERWEISVVRVSNEHGQTSWGWFDENKHLVSHNGGPCQWPICQFVWERQIKIARDLCDLLNAEET